MTHAGKDPQMPFHFAPSEKVSCSSAYDNSLWVFKDLHDEKPCDRLPYGQKAIVLMREINGAGIKRYLLLFEASNQMFWVDAPFVVARML